MEVREFRYPLQPAPSGVVAVPLEILRSTPPKALEYPAVVYTEPLGGRVTDLDRDAFWNAFGVPVFEQVVGHDGAIVAEECEAHEGLHLVGLFAPLLPGHTLVAGICPCGRREPRLIPCYDGRVISADADVAKLADALDLGSSSLTGV